MEPVVDDPAEETTTVPVCQVLLPSETEPLELLEEQVPNVAEVGYIEPATPTPNPLTTLN